MSSSSDAVWDIVQGRYDVSKLERLLRGVSISGWDMDGWTPLHYACDNKNVTSLGPLLAAGSKVDAIDEQGYTPLHLLCKNPSGAFAGLSELLDAGAPDGKRVTPLHLLCANESITQGALSALLKANADVNAVDGDGNTALHSLSANDTLTDALLGTYRPGAWTTQNQFKASALHYLCQNVRVTPTMLTLALAAHADPNLPDNTGNTPLHALCDNAATVSVAHLRVMLAHPSIDLMAMNASGRRAVSSLESDECIQYVERHGPYAALEFDASTPSTVPGGEDVADLPEPLRDIMTRWNGSLPPFDEAFYTTISCEPAFEGIYTQVQHASMLVAESPSDKALLMQWDTSMSAWRQTIVRAFLTLVNPRLWTSYANTFHRRIPDDVVKVQSKVEAIWTSFPDASQRRERLEAVQALY
ncbi:hypothetical protein B5M09_005384 [Aphanomyces astaci]|uniref:Uncharacterized protein n=1 Tax=Aphanomyces astaci TaxID=112090 RepID=A0A3R7XPK5_APHAT|nr:hypothetical protein B5M09_005384 [Aphanomyces astaci]